jgi:hypothetical protein
VPASVFSSTGFSRQDEGVSRPLTLLALCLLAIAAPAIAGDDTSSEDTQTDGGSTVAQVDPKPDDLPRLDTLVPGLKKDPPSMEGLLQEPEHPYPGAGPILKTFRVIAPLEESPAETAGGAAKPDGDGGTP